jgi:hypothetical protein
MLGASYEVRLAWRSIYTVGSKNGGPNCIGETRNAMDAVLATAGLYSQAQKQALQGLERSVESGQTKYALVVRGFDCTPRLLSFGSLTSTISPHARYLVPNNDKSQAQNNKNQEVKRFKLVTARELKALGRRSEEGTPQGILMTSPFRI